MNNHKAFKVGDKIIDHGQTHRIFKIGKKKTFDAQEKRIIYYRPCLIDDNDGKITYSIPIKNIDKTQIRRPILEKELREILEELSEAIEEEDQLNTVQLRETLRLNSPHKTAQILKILWFDKDDESTNFSKQKQDVFKTAMKRLIEEVALVTKTSLIQARQKVESALEKGKK